ncbi:hypothetical protein Pcinc_030578 [Petrolisthes cinctipes]|uniref:Uncharacterized protein n=1 Tax=Petrolisthes cinctipes TaxID=88211 RepID=A0AAE1EYJ0_PETCI|nr:hypothetical protein Pcinc_030578 [Petrolisthes cinctipes]
MTSLTHISHTSSLPLHTFIHAWLDSASPSITTTPVLPWPSHLSTQILSLQTFLSCLYLHTCPSILDLHTYLALAFTSVHTNSFPPFIASSTSTPVAPSLPPHLSLQPSLHTCPSGLSLHTCPSSLSLHTCPSTLVPPHLSLQSFPPHLSLQSFPPHLSLQSFPPHLSLQPLTSHLLYLFLHICPTPPSLPPHLSTVSSYPCPTSSFLPPHLSCL